MREKQIKELFNKYKAGICSPSEKNQVEAWLKELQGHAPEFDNGDMERDLDAVWQELHGRTRARQVKLSTFGILTRVAAVLVLGLCLYSGYRWWTHSPQNEPTLAGTQELSDDIPPGEDKAQLTLSDGRVVSLQEMEIGANLEQNGVVLKKLASGELVYQPAGGVPSADANPYNTITTPKGGQFKVVLPDGSRVWLNASSSLRYPTRFSDNRRIVELEGEAYFEVESQASRSGKVPFLVRSRTQEVEVLGTHFNINDYENEGQTKTTLLEGSVRVTLLEEGQKTGQYSTLKPGEASVVRGRKMSVYPTEAQHAVAWKDGYFHFEKADLKEVMRQFERWYDIQVVYREDRSDDEFVGDIPRDASLSKALRILSLGGVEFKREDRTVIITK